MHGEIVNGATGTQNGTGPAGTSAGTERLPIPSRSGGDSVKWQPEMSGRIGGYRLGQVIGRSDLATVYLARDERLDRQVAVKVLAPERAGQAIFLTRWLRESRVAAELGHPNILPVYQAGDADGVWYAAMRYVPGGDIRSMLSRAGPLRPAMAWTILAQAASALDAAHARGLVHRDVKPANMLLEASHVFLADFGMGADKSAGPFDYVAPEQIEGRPLNGRTDLYSLACVGFELLSGTPLFGHDQHLTVMYAQLYAPPPSVRTRRDDLPAAVDRVLATALAKNPADRYATCGQFAEELSAALGLGLGLGLSGQRSRPPDRTGRDAWPGGPPPPPPGPRHGSGQRVPAPARRAGPNSRRPAVIKGTLAAVAAAAVAAVVVVAAVAVAREVAAPGSPAASRPGVSQPAASRAATATPPRVTSPAPSPSALASGQAVAVGRLLSSSAATRQALNGAINEVLNCTNLSGAASQIQSAVSQRGSEYREASVLSASGLPEGAAVKSDLIAALRTSLDADQDYLTWARQELNLGCAQPEQSTAYGAANGADQAADAAKQAFVQVWNPIAVKYGVPQQSAGSI